MKTTLILAMLLFVQPVYAEGLCEVIDCEAYKNMPQSFELEMARKFIDLERRVKAPEEDAPPLIKLPWEAMQNTSSDGQSNEGDISESVYTDGLVWTSITSAPSDPTEQHINALKMIHAEELASGRTDMPFREWLIEKAED